MALLSIASLFVAYVWSPPEERSYDSPYLARVADRFVDTPTARFHYLQTGSGPPLVLIPGGTLWFYSYRKIIPALAHHFTIYAVDMPGQGYTEVSAKNFRYDLQAMSGALGSFMDALRLPRAAVAGHSWGGAIALYFAERNPRRVTRLGLIDAPGLKDPPPLTFRLLEFPLIGEMIGKLMNRSFYERGLHDTFVHQDRLSERDVDEYWAPMSFHENREAMWLEQRRFDYSLTDRALDKVRARTLVLWGAQDRLDEPWQATALARRIPTASVRILPHCGHAVPEDCPARAIVALEALLRDERRDSKDPRLDLGRA